MKKLLIVLCLVAAPVLAQDDPVVIRRPTGRVVPEKSAPECVYVESIWGSPCKVECEMNYVPMWFDDNRLVHFKMMTNKNIYGPAFSTFDFAGHDGGLELSVDWVDSLKWTEWWDRSPGEEFKAVPLMGCYCNDLTGVVSICVDGRLVSEIAAKAVEE